MKTEITLQNDNNRPYSKEPGANHIYFTISNVDISYQSILELLNNCWISDSLIEAYMLSLTGREFSYIPEAHSIAFSARSCISRFDVIIFKFYCFLKLVFIQFQTI